jgi:hypothetical protein
MYNPLEPRKFPRWRTRNSMAKNKEDELCLAAFDSKGKVVCRVFNIRRRDEAERAIRLVAAAPELADALQGACGYIRERGMCPWPDCGKCRIAETMNRLEQERK